ncbi:MAG: NusA-like transcription termination signal-binding factor [Methanolobus sp.]|uniref:NusA-like transcription termination signal-binding factor n=1 Tax=Methanolobus sp. TaxID=1874737 RepID=UPI002730D3B8|nr:NusA-like transcription termination signal-binding factor [Methanolobus sp.]MDP2217729.1 NusA-like transcription termination signal-binding factor [Methanolobus sp.]
MSEIKLSTEGLRYIALFEELTKATVKDCIIDDGRIIYVIKAGDMGAAIGKNGDHINRVKKTVDKQIDLVEYSDEPVAFIKNAFSPITVRSVNIVDRNNKRLAYVEVPNKDKGLAIGRNGKNIQKVKLVAKRHHDIDDVILQ